MLNINKVEVNIFKLRLIQYTKYTRLILKIWNKNGTFYLKHFLKISKITLNSLHIYKVEPLIVIF